MLINLKKKPQIIRKNAERCREKGIVLPTFAEMKDPSLIPQDIKDRLRNVGLWDVNPLNLYRINWHNEPKESGGGYGPVNFIEIPREITGSIGQTAPFRPAGLTCRSGYPAAGPERSRC